MNESLMRDLHDTQIEELTAVKTAIAELAQRPTATPTDIAKLQMMIANIRIPEQDNSQVMRELQKLSKIGSDNNEWLRAIHAQNKLQHKQAETNKALIDDCIDGLQQTYALIDNTSSGLQMSFLIIAIFVLVVTGVYLYDFVSNLFGWL